MMPKGTPPAERWMRRLRTSISPKAAVLPWQYRRCWHTDAFSWVPSKESPPTAWQQAAGLAVMPGRNPGQSSNTASNRFSGISIRHFNFYICLMLGLICNIYTLSYLNPSFLLADTCLYESRKKKKIRPAVSCQFDKNENIAYILRHILLSMFAQFGSSCGFYWIKVFVIGIGIGWAQPITILSFDNQYDTDIISFVNMHVAG
jgi:hypothetical protein